MPMAGCLCVLLYVISSSPSPPQRRREWRRQASSRTEEGTVSSPHPPLSHSPHPFPTPHCHSYKNHAMPAWPARPDSPDQQLQIPSLGQCEQACSRQRRLSLLHGKTLAAATWQHGNRCLAAAAPYHPPSHVAVVWTLWCACFCCRPPTPNTLPPPTLSNAPLTLCLPGIDIFVACLSLTLGEWEDACLRQCGILPPHPTPPPSIQIAGGRLRLPNGGTVTWTPHLTSFSSSSENRPRQPVTGLALTPPPAPSSAPS